MNLKLYNKVKNNLLVTDKVILIQDMSCVTLLDIFYVNMVRDFLHVGL